MRSILQVYASSLFSRVVFAGAGLLLIRFMAVAEFATFTLAFALVVLVAQPLIDLANRLYIIYSDIGTVPERMTIIAVMQVIVLLAAGVALAWLAPLPSPLIPITITAVATTIAFENGKTYYQGAQDFTSFWRLESTRSALYLAVVVGLILWRHDLTAFDALVALVTASIASVALPITRLIRSTPWGRLPAAWKEQLLRLSSVIDFRRLARRYDLVGYILVQAVIAQVSVLVLDEISTDYQLATFGSASRYYGFIILALASLQTVLLPALRQDSSEPEVRRLVAGHWRLTLIFVPAVAICAIAAIWVVPLIDAGRYPDAVLTFWTLCASSVLSFAFGVYPILALNRRMFGILFQTSCLALVLCIVSNWALVTEFGARGAALGTLVTHAFFNISMAISCRGQIAGARSSWAKPG